MRFLVFAVLFTANLCFAQGFDHSHAAWSSLLKKHVVVLEGGKGTMADFKYVDGASVLPGDDEVKKLRPVESN